VKVAFVLGTSTGGTARHVRMLAAGCAARGVLAEVFGPARTDRDFRFTSAASPPPPADAAQWTIEPVLTGTTDHRAGNAGSPSAHHDPPVTFTPVEIADRPRLSRDLRAAARLRRLFAAWRPDVVHAHGLRAGALAAIATALTRPTVYDPRPARVVTVHNAPAAGGVTGAVYRVLERIVAGRADSVLCVSADLEERMRAAGARRVGHAMVPADPIDVPAETLPAADPERPVVLAAGRLAAQKGFGILLRAAASWRDLSPEPVLVIVGDGPLEAELKSQAASLGPDVRFLGHRDDVPALLASATVFVLPSLWEGQPLILQEALHAGVPVVATRAGGTPEVTGEDAALLVPPGDARRLAGAVREVLTDPALEARLRLAAADRARALPTPGEAVAAALAEYERIARRRPAR
jgi:glycosyltransferase involved in cell wall biosynthesis